MKIFDLSAPYSNVGQAPRLGEQIKERRRDITRFRDLRGKRVADHVTRRLTIEGFGDQVI